MDQPTDEPHNNANLDQYRVGVVCALDIEMSAVRYMLDQEHGRFVGRQGDPNLYILGRLAGHNVVITCLPGNQGKSSASTVATHMSRTFPLIQHRLLVGIGGGVPSDVHDIRLGDVVVSMPDNRYGGVVQYDLGGDLDDGFRIKGFLHPPPAVLRSAVQLMRSDHMVAKSQIGEYLIAMWQRNRSLRIYRRPPSDSDILFNTEYRHDPFQPNCDNCDNTRIVYRQPREADAPEIHYGLIASGDRVMKSAAKRSALTQKVGDVLCFEMEAAGLMTELACIVIRGISDYADSHKNDIWQHYAAATAAACAKELLSYLDVEEIPSSIASAPDRSVSNMGRATHASIYGLNSRKPEMGPSFAGSRPTGESVVPVLTKIDDRQKLQAELRSIADKMEDPFARSGFELAKKMALDYPKQFQSFIGEGYPKAQLEVTRYPPIDHSIPQKRAHHDAFNDENSTDSPISKPKRCCAVKTGWSISRIENILGKIITDSKTRTKVLGASERVLDNETSYTMYPAEWILSLGIHLGARFVASRSISGWKWSLEPLHLVADTSLVIELCIQGNTAAVRTLIERGEASPNDTTLIGWSLLHIAAYYDNPDLFKFLLESGANPSAVTCEKDLPEIPPVMTPISTRRSPFDDTRHSSRRFDIGLFQLTPYDDFVFEPGSLGYYLIWALVDRYKDQTDHILSWVLREFSEDIKLSLPSRELVLLIAFGHSRGISMLEPLFRILDQRGLEEVRGWCKCQLWDYAYPDIVWIYDGASYKSMVRCLGCQCRCCNFCRPRLPRPPR